MNTAIKNHAIHGWVLNPSHTIKTFFAAIVFTLAFSACVGTSLLDWSPLDVTMGQEPVTDLIDLSSATTDWVHVYRDSDEVVQVFGKAGTNILPSPILNGSGSWHSVNNFNNTNGGITYIDGDGGALAGGSTLAVACDNPDFEIKVPASGNKQRLTLYVAGWNGGDPAVGSVSVYDEAGTMVKSIEFNSYDTPSPTRVIIDFRTDRADENMIVRLTKISGMNMGMAAYTLQNLRTKA